MVNKVAKGRRAEKELADFLSEKGGYIVWRPSRTRWGSKDIFNIADIIAIQQSDWLSKYEAYFFGNARVSPVVFIQVKTNKTDYYKAIKQVSEFRRKVNGLVHFVVALKIRGSRWKFWEAVADMDGHSFEIDLKTGKCYERGKHTYNWNAWMKKRKKLKINFEETFI